MQRGLLRRLFHSSSPIFGTRKKARQLRPPTPPLVFKPYLGDMPAMEISKLLKDARTPSDAEKELPAAKKPRMDDDDGVVAVALPDGGSPTSTLLKTVKKSGKKRIKRKDRALPEKFSPEDVLWRDIVSVVGKEVVDEALEEATEFDSPYDTGDLLEVEIVSLSSTGEALGLAKGKKRHPWVIVTRFCLPGETVRVRVYWNRRLHSYAEMLEVLTPNLELRDNSRIECKYFGQCGGCQYQMLSYDQQLKLKRDVIIKAYRNFSGLPDLSVPVVLNTIPSPLQYGYRTKLTPHFDAPPKEHRKKKAAIVDGKAVKPEWLNIGFNKAGTHRVMDIEECPISTPILNNALPSVRENIYHNIHKYEKGVSLTLRDSMQIPNAESSISNSTNDDAVSSSPTLLEERHICTTDPRATVRERVSDWLFEYNASSFFQNNNSVLRPLTDYVRDAIFPPATTTIASSSLPPPLTHLVDAYCGAGLFSITLSPYFEKIAGIELSSESIKAARHNAETLNRIPQSKITFREGDAGDLFASVRRRQQHQDDHIDNDDTDGFPPSRTVLVIDPPRKGCDEKFIQQALDFRCGTIVYVSCNVHTQARDVGRFVEATKDDGEGRRYVIESLRGFDLFPQTAHIEGVAVLRLR